MRTEIIISTYNAPRFLHLTLTGILGQDVRPDSIAIADDGSGPETLRVIEAFRTAHPKIPVRHVWHADDGFRKNDVLDLTKVEGVCTFTVFGDTVRDISEELEGREEHDERHVS